MVWEEATGHDTPSKGAIAPRSLAFLSDHDPWIRDTYNIGVNSESKAMAAVLSLTNTTHAKALTTAMEMVSSHHALGVEAMKNTTGDKSQYKTAIHHHLHAWLLLCEVQRQHRGEPARRNSKNLVGDTMNVVSGTGRKLTVRGKDLSVVSSIHAFCFNPDTMLLT